MLTVDHHPLLDARALVLRYPAPLGELATPPGLLALLDAQAGAPLASSDAVRQAVRALLRHGGFKPTGRNKPASEYLRNAAADGRLGSINLAADLGNAVSLHSGLPISVLDRDRLEAPLGIAIPTPGQGFVFNRSGQVIDVTGLVCLMDAHGPCGNAVKDAQRTKTDHETRATLGVIWGTVAAPGLAERACAWYQELARQVGAEVERVL